MWGPVEHRMPFSRIRKYVNFFPTIHWRGFVLATINKCFDHLSHVHWKDAQKVWTCMRSIFSMKAVTATDQQDTVVLWVRVSVCVVCVCFPFILDINFVGRTSRGHTGGRSHRIFHPPSFCGACLNFSREKDSAIPFPRRL